MTYLAQNYLAPSLEVRKALRSFYGIGRFRAHHMCDQLGLPPSIRVGALSPSQLGVLTRFVTHMYFTEGDLRRAIGEDIHRLIRIASYRGFRHVARLPLRGQRTRTNSRSSRRTRARA